MKVQKYSSLAQKINADFLCDEGNPVICLVILMRVLNQQPKCEDITSNFASQHIENPLMESKEEQELAVGIDEELNEVDRSYARAQEVSFSNCTHVKNLKLIFSSRNRLIELIISNFS